MHRNSRIVTGPQVLRIVVITLALTLSAIVIKNSNNIGIPILSIGVETAQAGADKK